MAEHGEFDHPHWESIGINLPAPTEDDREAYEYFCADLSQKLSTETQKARVTEDGFIAIRNEATGTHPTEVRMPREVLWNKIIDALNAFGAQLLLLETENVDATVEARMRNVQVKVEKLGFLGYLLREKREAVEQKNKQNIMHAKIAVRENILDDYRHALQNAIERQWESRILPGIRLRYRQHIEGTAQIDARKISISEGQDITCFMKGLLVRVSWTRHSVYLAFHLPGKKLSEQLIVFSEDMTRDLGEEYDDFQGIRAQRERNLFLTTEERGMLKISPKMARHCFVKEWEPQT